MAEIFWDYAGGLSQRVCSYELKWCSCSYITGIKVMFPRLKEAILFFQLLSINEEGVTFSDVVIKHFCRSHTAVCWPLHGNVSAQIFHGFCVGKNTYLGREDSIQGDRTEMKVFVLPDLPLHASPFLLANCLILLVTGLCSILSVSKKSFLSPLPFFFTWCSMVSLLSVSNLHASVCCQTLPLLKEQFCLPQNLPPLTGMLPDTDG